MISLPLTLHAKSEYPNISGEVYTQVTAENNTSYKDNNATTMDSDYEKRRAFAEIYADLNFNLKKYISVQTSFQIQQMNTRKENKHQYFDEHGVALTQLKINVENDLAGIYAGKFNPAFGKGWDWTANTGIWGNDFASDYRITDKIGLGAVAKLDLEAQGKHKIRLESFFSDTTELSDSIVTRRGRLKKSDGGSANTEELSSYTLTLEGSDIGYFEDIKYNIGYRMLEDGTGGLGDEQGFVVGASYKREIANRLLLEPMFEYADINNFNSNNITFMDKTDLSADVKYLTFGAALLYEKLNLSSFYSRKEFDRRAATNVEGSLFEVSVGYKFENGIKVAIGRKSEEATDQSEKVSAGLQASYRVLF